MHKTDLEQAKIDRKYLEDNFGVKMISIKNGQPCQVVDSQDRAFLYGDGFFTTIKVIKGQPQLWPRHIERLIECAEQLAFDLDIEEVDAQVNHFLSQYPKFSGALKIIVSRGEGQRGYMPPEQKADIYLHGFPGAIPTAHISQQLIKSPIHSGVLLLTLGHTMPALVGLKTLNRLEQVLLRHELASTPWDEALVADIHGNIVEGVASNCFLYMHEKWYTPILDQAGIAGVMRAEILDKMLTHDIAHSVVNVPKAAIKHIEAMFFCNALTGIVPVKTLLDRPLEVAPVQSLIDQFGW